MALKKRSEDRKEKNKLIEILTKDYKWENIFLGILALVAAVIAVMIMNKTLTIDSTFPLLGKGNNGVIFASFLLVISIIGLVLVLIPFFIPASSEVKKIAWPRWNKFLENSLQTIVFVAILTLLLLLFDYVIVSVIERLPNGK